MKNKNKNNIDYETIITEYEEKYKLNLPRRMSHRYLYIEDISDYEYTNSIAYEMVRRNKEFKELTKNPYNIKTEEWKIQILKLGLDPMINNFPSEPNFLLQYNTEDQRFFYESWLSHTIDDIKNGLEKLINYYLSKDNIFLLHNEKEIYNLESYIKVNNISISNILDSPTNYYIPCSFADNCFIKMDTKDMVRMQQISNKIPLRILEKDFLNSIQFTDTKYKYTQLMPFYSRPEFSFPYADVVNIPINLNLEKEELIAYILKAKKEYDKKLLTIKHPLELIGNEYNKPNTIKSEKDLPTEKDKRKIAVADAFYVYDLFQIFEPYFKQEQEKLRKERAAKIIEIQNKFKNIKDAKKIKENNISELKQTYRENIKQYSKNEINTIIASITSLSFHKVERYYKYMREYIDNKRYTELITGKQSS